MANAMSQSPTSKSPTEKHPKGLYVLFATEMWERFSFYSMLSMFTLYLQDPVQGFGWTAAQATSLYSTYLMFVYASPLAGGWMADKKLGYRKAVMFGGLFFIAGHLLLAFHSLSFVYSALACLVIGNGFFKPNVSTMVGNLYPEGSSLKDSAYNIFYMGINIGAFAAPLVAEFMHGKYGYHPAFAVAAGGMVISVLTMAIFKKYVEPRERDLAIVKPATVSVDKLPHIASKQETLEAVPEARRLFALCVIFIVVIVFWMCFQQNFSTFTYFADKNTRWNVTGIISNSLNPFWIITLTPPLVWFWRWLNRKGWEPSTPVKMAIGMVFTATAFYILALASHIGGNTGKVSPLWIVGAYCVLTMSELLVSPMGLSLVSKVAPKRMRGFMTGAWFLVIAIGGKLTMIGVYWDYWTHSKFFTVLGTMALGTAFILFLLLKPLKKAMPGV